VPVRHSIRALCQPPDATLLAGFRQHFEQKGKARLQLSVVVEENGQTCVEFTGEFVAIRG
jgi:thioesterase domain-containing protein